METDTESPETRRRHVAFKLSSPLHNCLPLFNTQFQLIRPVLSCTIIIACPPFFLLFYLTLLFFLLFSLYFANLSQRTWAGIDLQCLHVSVTQELGVVGGLLSVIWLHFLMSHLYSILVQTPSLVPCISFFSFFPLPPSTNRQSYSAFPLPTNTHSN